LRNEAGEAKKNQRSYFHDRPSVDEFVANTRLRRSSYITGGHDQPARTNTAAGQRAIAAAEAWAIAEAEGKVTPHGGNMKAIRGNPTLIKDPPDHFGKLFGVNEQTVRMARALLKSDPDNAAKVKANSARIALKQIRPHGTPISLSRARCLLSKRMNNGLRKWDWPTFGC